MERVWIQAYPRKNKVGYRLRWLDTATGKWRSKTVGTDKKRADREAADLERQLTAGTYSEVANTKATWEEFTDDHVKRLPGAANQGEARRCLEEFGRVVNKPPRLVTFNDIELFVAAMRAKGNTVATISKKLRYCRHAFRMGMKRGYLGRNPMADWKWERQPERAIRELGLSEEARLLAAAETLYGHQTAAFIRTALATGGRKNEIIGLEWPRIDLDGGTVVFTETKGKRDRVGYLDPPAVAALRKLQPQTMLAGGPFKTLNIRRRWAQICLEAGIEALTVHDLRRTAISRLCRAGAALKTVKELAGHKSIQTTERYYVNVTDEDRRKAVANMRKGAIA